MQGLVADRRNAACIGIAQQGACTLPPIAGSYSSQFRLWCLDMSDISEVLATLVVGIVCAMSYQPGRTGRSVSVIKM